MLRNARFFNADKRDFEDKRRGPCPLGELPLAAHFLSDGRKVRCGDRDKRATQRKGREMVFLRGRSLGRPGPLLQERHQIRRPQRHLHLPPGQGGSAQQVEAVIAPQDRPGCTSDLKLSNGMRVRRPSLTISRSPDWISSYNRDLLMPVSRTAVGIRTVSGSRGGASR